MTRRLYLCGACAKLPDLGVSWRKRAEEALRQKGYAAIWPPDIADVAGGWVDTDEARREWTLRRKERVFECLRALRRADGVLWEISQPYGVGTETEIKVARWADMPVLQCNTSNPQLVEVFPDSEWAARRLGWTWGAVVFRC